MSTNALNTIKSHTIIYNFAAVLLLLALPAAAQITLWDQPQAPLVKLQATGQAEIAAGSDALLPLKIEIPEQYLLYSPAPRGKQVQPITLEVTASGSPQLTAGKTLFPKPQWHTVDLAGLKEDNLVYEHELEIFIPLTANDTSGGDAPLLSDVTVRLKGQLCDANGCYPVNISQQFTVTILPAGSPKQFSTMPKGYMTAGEMLKKMPQDPPKASIPANGKASAAPNSPGATLTTWAALAIALLAGVSLNVMPCVLPVIPIKILSIVQQAGDSSRRRVQLGMSYALGIFVFFLLIGIASVAVRLAGSGVFNLNEPFKSPAFIISMVLLLSAASGWLFGAFNLWSGSISGGGASNKGGVAGSIVMGFFTALLATPCSGPVLAAVFGWAQWRSAAAGMAVFASLGIGMALPHAILASMPKLLDKLPKPGMWTERLRQAMGFILLVVAAWLLSVLGDAAWIFRVATLAVILSACLWFGWTVVGFNASKSKRNTTRLAMVIIFALSAAALGPKPTQGSIQWKNFDSDSITATASSGKIVLVKYTAQWCTLCKIVDMKIYSDDQTAKLLEDFDTTAFKADVTWNDTPAEIFLTEQLTEPGPPLTVIYGPAIEEPLRLRGVFTKEDLSEALKKAAGKQ